MKKIISLFAAAAVLFCSGCEKDGTLTIRTIPATAEEVILDVQGTHKITRYKETDDDYILCFPEPVSEAATGGSQVTLSKTVVAGFKEYDESVKIDFVDGESATVMFTTSLSADICTDIELETVEGQQQPVSFNINGGGLKTDAVLKDLQAGGGCYTADLTMEADGKKGTIVFVVTQNFYYTLQAELCISNEFRERKYCLNVTCNPLKFKDGTDRKEYYFPEQERIFDIDMGEGNGDTDVLIPEECKDWIKAVHIKNRFRFLLRANESAATRSVSIQMTNKKTSKILQVKVSQIGEQEDCSVRSGLAELYRCTGGDNWNNRDNWCSDRPLTEWYGIKYNGKMRSKTDFGEDGEACYGTVSDWSIEMRSNNMSGTVPEPFWKAGRFFQKICFSYETDLHGTLPDSIWNENLQYLTLVRTRINAPLGPSIKNAVNLYELKIWGTDVIHPVSSVLPDEIGSLSRLFTLSLPYCGLTGSLPDGFWKLNPYEINLSYNPELKGELTDDFYKMNFLSIFRITKTQIGGTIKPEIKSLVSLRYFDISYCEFRGEIPEEMGEMGLSDLGLSACLINGNYITRYPDFFRFKGTGRTWVGLLAPYSANNFPFKTRPEETGRPADYLDNPKKYLVSSYMPIWGRVRFGYTKWNSFYENEVKIPEWPVADDLQYPADEYYLSEGRWRHAKLEYPADEYWFDGKEWIHDETRPWNREYIPGSTEFIPVK